MPARLTSIRLKLSTGRRATGFPRTKMRHSFCAFPSNVDSRRRYSLSAGVCKLSVVDRLRVALLVRKHQRNFTQFEHAARDAAQDSFPNAGMTIGSHENKISTDIASGFQDNVSDIATVVTTFLHQ